MIANDESYDVLLDDLYGADEELVDPDEAGIDEGLAVRGQQDESLDHAETKPVINAGHAHGHSAQPAPIPSAGGPAPIPTFGGQTARIFGDEPVRAPYKSYHDNSGNGGGAAHAEESYIKPRISDSEEG